MIFSALSPTQEAQVTLALDYLQAVVLDVVDRDIFTPADVEDGLADAAQTEALHLVPDAVLLEAINRFLAQMSGDAVVIKQDRRYIQ